MAATSGKASLLATPLSGYVAAWFALAMIGQAFGHLRGRYPTASDLLLRR
jgi:hypothetical protein